MFTIGLGYEGPTDECLTLSFNGVTKEYLIEGTGWRMLNMILHVYAPFRAVPYIAPKSSIAWWTCYGIWESDREADLRNPA